MELLKGEFLLLKTKLNALMQTGNECKNFINFSEGFARRDLSLVRLNFEIKLRKLEEKHVTTLKSVAKEEKEAIDWELKCIQDETQRLENLVVNLQTAAEKQKTRVFHEEVRFLQKIIEKTAKTFKRKKLKFQVNKEVREFFDNLETIGAVDTEIIESSGLQKHLQSPTGVHDVHANDTQLNDKESHFDMKHKDLRMGGEELHPDVKNKETSLNSKESHSGMKHIDKQSNGKESDFVVENKCTYLNSNESISDIKKKDTQFNGNGDVTNKRHLSFKSTENHDPRSDSSSICSRKEATRNKETKLTDTRIIGRDGNKENTATNKTLRSSITDPEKHVSHPRTTNTTETRTDIVLTEEDWIRYRETELNHASIKPQSEKCSKTVAVRTESENAVHKLDRRSVLQDLCKKLETRTQGSSDKTVLGHRVEDGEDKAVNTEDQTTFHSAPSSCKSNWDVKTLDENQDFSSNVNNFKTSNKPRGIIKNWPNSKSSLRRSKSDSSKYSNLKSGLSFKEKDMREKKTHHYHVTFADASVQNSDESEEQCKPTVVSSEQKHLKTEFTNLKSPVIANCEQKPHKNEVTDVNRSVVVSSEQKSLQTEFKDLERPVVVNSERTPHKTELPDSNRSVVVSGEQRPLKTEFSRSVVVSGGLKSLNTELTLNKRNVENNAKPDATKNLANSRYNLRRTNSDSSKYLSLKIDFCSKENAISKEKLVETFEATCIQNRTKNEDDGRYKSAEVSGDEKPLSIPINKFRKNAEDSSEKLGTIKNWPSSKCDLRRTKSDAMKHSNLMSGLGFHDLEKKILNNETFDASSDRNREKIMNDDQCNSNSESVEEKPLTHDFTDSNKNCIGDGVKLVPNRDKKLDVTKQPEVGSYNTFPSKAMSCASYEFFNESPGPAAGNIAVNIPNTAQTELTTTSGIGSDKSLELESLDSDLTASAIVRNTAGELNADISEKVPRNNIQESESDVTDDSIPESSDLLKSYPYLTNGFKVSNKRLAAYVRRRLHVKAGDYPDTIQSVLLKPNHRQYLPMDTTNVSQTFGSITKRNKHRQQSEIGSVERADSAGKPSSNMQDIQDIPRQAKSNRQRLPSSEEMLFDS